MMMRKIALTVTTTIIDTFVTILGHIEKGNQIVFVVLPPFPRQTTRRKKWWRKAADNRRIVR